MNLFVFLKNLGKKLTIDATVNGTKHDGDMYKLVHVLSKDVGVRAIFSDWSATVTYYANCFNLF